MKAKDYDMMTDEIRKEAYALLRVDTDREGLELSANPWRAYLQLVACKALVSGFYSQMMGSATFTHSENRRKYERAAARLGALEAIFEERCIKEMEER